VGDQAQVPGTRDAEPDAASPTSEPCVMLIFGASGDLTKRLLVPALYNLACDGLLSERFALLGASMDKLTTESFRARMSEDIKKFHTRHAFDQKVWDDLVARFHYTPAAFDDLGAFQALKAEVAQLDAEHQVGGNVLFYFATAPRFFGLICEQLYKAGFKDGPGWKRIIVEKPFGTDLASALQLNQDVLAHWDEYQI
jgi:glucose-6-phosphate 1-dehydrogenase